MRSQQLYNFDEQVARIDSHIFFLLKVMESHFYHPMNFFIFDPMLNMILSSIKIKKKMCDLDLNK